MQGGGTQTPNRIGSSSAIEREPQVRLAMSRLAEAVERVSAESERLIARIDGVLRPTPSATPEKGPGAPMPPTCHLAIALDDVREKLLQIAAHLSDASNCVEL